MKNKKIASKILAGALAMSMVFSASQTAFAEDANTNFPQTECKVNGTHKWVFEMHEDPTCIDEGGDWYYCDYCLELFTDNVVPATGEHDFSELEVIRSATFESDGLASTKCVYCGNESGETVPIYKLTSVTLEKDKFNYTGSVPELSVILKDSQGNTIDPAGECSVEAEGAGVGKHKATVNFFGNRYLGSTTVDYEIVGSQIGKASVNKTNFVYNGKTQKPSIVVKDTVGHVIPASQYTVTGGGKGVGTYVLTVKGNGSNVTGTTKVSYNILPKGTSISKLTKSKKAFTVKWKKQASQTTGYQIQYSLKSNFSGSKTTTISKNSTVSKKIKGLKSKKNYYVRIRTYKKVNGKTYYSAWSGAKKVKTK